ncbi:uncharacterized protein LOC135318360 [Phalacrocorax carbo]|uniref:uncharacterized protein LOC135318360 n=1 Tax=Phalacrocorax carbo TaxID=9209 RepID=UPI003119D94E
MGPLRLVPLLTSLQMLLLRAAVTDLPPPPPAITVTPWKSEYLIGDTVSMQCVAPGSKEKLQGFQFAGTSGWAVNIRTPRRACVYSFNITGPKDGGAHLCTYTLLNKARRPVRSQESEAVVINVRDHPPQPTLALKSSTAVTVEGQPLLFLCAAPAGDSERRFNFYNGKAKVADGTVVASGAAEAQLRVPGSHRHHTGNFTCGYEEKTEGRWIPSYRSRAVGVLVREAALAPRLGVDPPTGVVGEDYPLHLTCEASRDDFTLRFRFYRNGLEISPGQAGSKLRRIGNFSEFFFPRIPKSFGGNFSCAVEEDVGGTWVPTPRSEAVGVTVKAPPSQPSLLLDPPSGDVIDGDPLGLTCAAAGPAAPRKFAFYKDGVQQFTAMAAAERFRFTIPAAEARRASGRFTCRYEEKVSDWWIPSPLSEAMTVTAQARPQLIPLVAGCAAGAAMLVLGLLLAVCLYRRRRGGVHWKWLHNKDDPSTYPMASFAGGNM